LKPFFIQQPLANPNPSLETTPLTKTL